MTTNVRSWYIARDIIDQRERPRFWTRFPWVSRMSRLECLHWKQSKSRDTLYSQKIFKFEELHYSYTQYMSSSLAKDT